MSDAYKSIKQGLKEALEFSKGKQPKAIVHESLHTDAKDIRGKVGMSQNE